MKWLWIGVLAAGVAVFTGCSDGGSSDTAAPTTNSATNSPEVGAPVSSDGPAKVEEKDYRTGEQGLKYAILSPGSGAEAKEGDKVHMHYTGWLEDGTKFDSSRDRGETFAFMLGAGEVIKGWDLGVKGMKVGEKRQLRIPSEIGYGERGAGTDIPPNATLIFDVELVRIGE